MSGLTRRDFLRNISASGLLLPFRGITAEAGTPQTQENATTFQIPEKQYSSEPLNLEPARWIWYPSERTLQNTMLLFRREVNRSEKVRRATGWLAADSRYLLYVNGQRIQWGPAPADPRWPEADPLDLTDALQPGVNIIGVQVLFYGQGDGTWPAGKPGFLFSLEVESENGKNFEVLSDQSWMVRLCRAWQPGHYKRWYLRALQEEFDTRKYPKGWTHDAFRLSKDWLPAMELRCPADKPSLCARYPEYMLEIQGDRETSALFERSVPLLEEYRVPVEQLAEAYRIRWNRPPQEYFEFVPPDAFSAESLESIQSSGKNAWEVDLEKDTGVALTFELKEQVVGWPYCTIDAPAGTQIELMVHEGHEVGGPPLLNSHFHSWTRFTCSEGPNEFETFDYESLRWLQLHIHGSAGKVRISEVGVRRRIYPWPNSPEVACSEPDLQRLFDASVNTLHNSAQETIVDGMGRERQQYSGDVGHQLHAIYFTFGEHLQPARYLKTFSQGLTKDGYFLDCWPAYDRLARLMERQMDLTQWGPLLDHGVGFVFDNYHHYRYTGRLDDLREPYPRLLRFVEYLESIRRWNGLLPVEDIGIPAVWIDHDAYQQQRHKQCAFNLYAAAMLKHALAPLCRAFGDTKNARAAEQFGEELLQSTVRHFWSAEHGLFVNNLPWLPEEQGIRLCDRSLATAVLFDQCPENSIERSVRTLVKCPDEMGFSYPANAGWRLWALGKAGRQDVILREFRGRWAAMDSVILNNTLQENWEVNPDSGAQWSHCPVAPLYVLHMSLLGLKPLEPGFRRYEVLPRLADIGDLDVHARFPGNEGLHFKTQGPPDKREIMITAPSLGSGELVVRAEEQIDLDEIPGEQESGWKRYALPAGEVVRFQLSYS